MSLIRNLFNRIMGAPREPVRVAPPEVPEVDNTLATIGYQLRSDGHVSVLASWEKEDVQAAHFFAQLLYAIHSGRLERQTIEMLAQYAAAKPEQAPFLEEMYRKYQEIGDVVNHLSVIKPSDVIGLNRVMRNRE